MVKLNRQVSMRGAKSVTVCGPLHSTLSYFQFSTYLKELSGIIIAVIYSDGPAANTNIKSDSEVSWLEWHVGSILLQDHLALEEGALHGSAVDLLGLDHEDGAVLQEVVDHQLPDPEVLQPRLHHALLEVPEETQHLVKFKSISKLIKKNMAVKLPFVTCTPLTPQDSIFQPPESQEKITPCFRQMGGTLWQQGSKRREKASRWGRWK